MKNKEKNSLLKPDFLDLDGDGNKEESMKKASEDKEEMREPKAEGGNPSKMFTESESNALRNINFVLPSDNERRNLLNYILENNKFPEKRYNFRKNENTQMFGLPDEVFKKNPEAYVKALSYELYPVVEPNLPKDRSLEDIRKLVLEDKREYQMLDLDKPIRMPNEIEQMEQLKREQKEEGGEMKMLPDEQMEEQFVDFVIDEALSDKEESMLMEQLEANPELSMIFDKVIEKASEFTGAGEVEGPGTGVSDSIPARLSDGEFVFTAKSVEQIGADNLMKMMKDAEAAFDSAGKDRKAMEHGGPHSAMDDDNMSNMPKQVEVTYNVNRPESVSTVNPLLARDEEEDLISQQLKEGMLSRPDNIYS
jgi:hypothetical protein